MSHDGLPAAIVWDLDGTLVDSAPDLAAALNTLLAEHGHCGHSVRRVRGMIGMGVNRLIERGFAASGNTLTHGQSEAMIPAFMAIYAREATVRTRLFPRVQQVLALFCKLGVRQGVCTNKPEAVSRQIMDDLGLSALIQNITGGDTTAARKPDPRPLAACLGALGTRPETSVMIGDSLIDVRTARNLHMPVGLVSWGYTHTPVEQLGADFIIKRLTDLPGLLRSINPGYRVGGKSA